MKKSNEQKSWNVPLPTKEDIMEDKTFDMETYAMMMLISNFGGSVLNEDDRYLYVNKLEEQRKYICEILGITSRTLTSRIKKLENHHSRIMKQKTINNERGEENLVYKLKFKDRNKRKYATINSYKLELILKQKKKHLVKVYLLMIYMCKDKYGNSIERHMDYSWIAKRVGLKDKEWIGDCVLILEKLGFIKIRRKRSVKSIKDSNNQWIKIPIITHYYKLI